MLVYGVTSEVEIKIGIRGLHKKRRFAGSLLKIYIIYSFISQQNDYSK